MEDGFELGCVYGCVDHASGGKCVQGICAGHTFPQTFSTLSLTVPNPRLFLGSWFGDFPSLPLLGPGESRPVFKFRLGHHGEAMMRLSANHVTSLSLNFPIYAVGTRITFPAP